MAAKFVVGLFQSKGIAEDALHRLRTEGVPEGYLRLLVLHETAPLPQAVEPAMAALSVDPLVIGNVRDTFAPFIRNGETALFVQAEDEAAVDQAVSTIKQYAPVKIKVVTPTEGAPLSHDIL